MKLSRKIKSKKYRPLFIPHLSLTILFLVLFTSLVGYLVFSIQRGLVYDDFKENIAQMNDLAITLMKGDVPTEDFRNYFNRMFMQDENIKALVVYNRSMDRIISRYKDGLKPEYFILPEKIRYTTDIKPVDYLLKEQISINDDEENRKHYEELYEDFMDNNKLSDGIIRIVSPAGKEIGKVSFMTVFFYDVSDMMNASYYMVKKIIVGTAILSILHLFMTIFFYFYYISKPLKNFITVARNITRGRFKQKVRYYRNDEFAEFVLNFNNMIDFLWASRLEDRLAHPSTGLPTSVSIAEKVDSVIKQEDKTQVAYFYVKNQDEYIHKYGASYGENIMGFVTQTIFNIAYEKDPEFYLAHVTDSIFLGITNTGDMSEIARNIVIDFETKVEDFLESSSLKEIPGKKLLMKVVCLQLDGESSINNYRELERNTNELKDKFSKHQDISFISKFDDKTYALTVSQLLSDEEPQPWEEEPQTTDEKPAEQGTGNNNEKLTMKNEELLKTIDDSQSGSEKSPESTDQEPQTESEEVVGEPKNIINQEIDDSKMMSDEELQEMVGEDSEDQIEEAIKKDDILSDDEIKELLGE